MAGNVTKWYSGNEYTSANLTYTSVGTGLLVSFSPVIGTPLKAYYHDYIYDSPKQRRFILGDLRLTGSEPSWMTDQVHGIFQWTKNNEVQVNGRYIDTDDNRWKDGLYEGTFNASGNSGILGAIHFSREQISGSYDWKKYPVVFPENSSIDQNTINRRFYIDDGNIYVYATDSRTYGVDIYNTAGFSSLQHLTCTSSVPATKGVSEGELVGIQYYHGGRLNASNEYVTAPRYDFDLIRINGSSEGGYDLIESTIDGGGEHVTWASYTFTREIDPLIADNLQIYTHTNSDAPITFTIKNEDNPRLRYTGLHDGSCTSSTIYPRIEGIHTVTMELPSSTTYPAYTFVNEENVTLPQPQKDSYTLYHSKGVTWTGQHTMHQWSHIYKHGFTVAFTYQQKYTSNTTDAGLYSGIYKLYPLFKSSDGRILLETCGWSTSSHYLRLKINGSTKVTYTLPTSSDYYDVVYHNFEASGNTNWQLDVQRHDGTGHSAYTGSFNTMLSGETAYLQWCSEEYGSDSSSRPISDIKVLESYNTDNKESIDFYQFDVEPRNGIYGGSYDHRGSGFYIENTSGNTSGVTYYKTPARLVTQNVPSDPSTATTQYINNVLQGYSGITEVHTYEPLTELQFNPSAHTFDYTAASATTAYNNNSPWMRLDSVEGSESWIHPTKFSDFIRIQVDENEGVTNRTGYVICHCTLLLRGFAIRTTDYRIPIDQGSHAPFIALDPSEIETGASGGTADIAITKHGATIDNATSSVSWITPTMNAAKTNLHISIDANPTLSSRTGTVTVSGIVTDTGDPLSATVTVTQTGQERTARPIVTPESGDYYTSVTANVEMAANTTYYYTTDGSEPTVDSEVYTGPMTFTKTTTLKVIALDTEHLFPSESVIRVYTVHPPQARKAARNHDDENGIYVKRIEYVGPAVESRSYVVPTPTITDNEVDVTWGYHVDDVDEDLGEDGTKVHVDDTNIKIHIVFDWNGTEYEVEKLIPVMCVVSEEMVDTYTLDIIEAYAIMTLDNKFKVYVKSKVRVTTDETISILQNLDDFNLYGTSNNGNFTCTKEGSYFVYEGILTDDYLGSQNPSNEVLLTLKDKLGQEIDHYVIQVTFETGSIFDVRDDAIRMAVAASSGYTDGQISGVTNMIGELEVNFSAITATVEQQTRDISGLTSDIGQLQVRANEISLAVSAITEDYVTHSELAVTASAISASVWNEFGERTGLDIEDGIITLHAEQTVIDGQLNISDGITFRDDRGNPVTTVDGEAIDDYYNHDNGIVSYFNAGGQTSPAVQYGYTTGKYPIGTYQSGDTISFLLIEATSVFVKAGSSTPEYDTSPSIVTQIQLFKNDDSEPFETYSPSLTKTSDGHYRKEQNPIYEFTVPANNANVSVRFVNTSPKSGGGTGVASGSMWIKYGQSKSTHNHIGKSGIIVDHTVNNTTYIGANQFTLRKDTDGFSFMPFTDALGTKRYQPAVSSLYSYYSNPSSTWPNTPDRHNTGYVYGWTPFSNYTPHTVIGKAVTNHASSSGPVVEVGAITGYDWGNDIRFLRIDERYLVGDLWVDKVFDTNYSETDVTLLLPPVARQVTYMGRTCTYHLPEGYTVRILALRNAYIGNRTIRVAANHMDCPSSYDTTAKFFTPNGGVNDYVQFNAADTYIEFIYQGSWGDGISEEYWQRWYVRNWNNQ